MRWENYERSKFRRDAEIKEFSLGHAKFEVYVRHPDGNTK